MTELSSNIEEPSELGKERDGIINIKDESLSKSDIMRSIQLLSREDIFRNIRRWSLLPHHVSHLKATKSIMCLLDTDEHLRDELIYV